MHDRTVKQPVERRGRIVEPLGGEAVLDQQLVLGLQLSSLALAGGEPQAARMHEGVAGERGQPRERPLGQLPVVDVQEPGRWRGAASSAWRATQAAITSRYARGDDRDARGGEPACPPAPA